jgi:PBSX family phage terminase large subunit
MTIDEIAKLVSLPQILSIVDSTKRPLALWSGSVSAGKTVASLFAFLLAVRKAPKDGLIVIVGRSLQTVYQNIFVLFQNTSIFGTKISSQIKYTPGANSATIFGREVMIVGANNAASVGRIQGATIGLAYVDEAALMPEAFWDMLTTRLRVNGARLLATMNPASTNHWIRKKWIMKADLQDLIHFKFTMADNPNLDAAYVARMQRSYAGVFYDRMIKGEWTNAAGAVYPMWDEKRHIIPFASMPKISRVLADGIDFGVSNASAALRVGITAEKLPRLILMDEWRYDPRDHYGATLAPSDQAVMYRKWRREQHTPHEMNFDPEYTIVDPAASAFSSELRKFDEIEPTNAHNAVMGRIGMISRLLANDRMVVTERCAGWNSEVTEYRWDPKATDKGEDSVVKEDDHSLDAGGYGIYTTRSESQYELEEAA